MKFLFIERFSNRELGGYLNVNTLQLVRQLIFPTYIKQKDPYRLRVFLFCFCVRLFSLCFSLRVFLIIGQTCTRMGKVVAVTVDIAQALIMFFIAFKILDEVVADTEHGCGLNAANLDVADMKGRR